MGWSLLHPSADPMKWSAVAAVYVNVNFPADVIQLQRNLKCSLLKLESVEA
jgi:hypothetical protein